MTDEFPSQIASKAESVAMSWFHDGCPRSLPIPVVMSMPEVVPTWSPSLLPGDIVAGNCPEICERINSLAPRINSLAPGDYPVPAK